MNTTFDGLLNRRVTLEQPAQGYRVAVDTVLLAAAVPARAGETVLDLGCGVGGAMLCLTCRVPGISVTGLEIQPELAEIARRNIAANAFPAEMKIVQGDVTRIFDEAELHDSSPLVGEDRWGGVRLGGSFQNLNCQSQLVPPLPNPPHEGNGINVLLSSSFDHALMNPPYHDEARHDVSIDASKRAANTEKDGDLEKWIASAARALKSGGTLTLIHRADRQSEILAHVSGFFGSIALLPIAPKENMPPRRIIIRATKGAQPSVRQHKSLVLHRADGGFTDEAESILRHAKSLDFQSAIV